MKSRFLITVSALFFATLPLSAQKTVTEEEKLWLGLFNQTRFSDKWGLWADFHFRLRDNFVGDAAQFIGRVGPMYYLTEDVRLTAAYAYVHHFPAEGHANIAQPEHRPWQQIQWFTRGSKVRLMQWVRLEERFRRKILNDDELAEGYLFNWRVRYNFALFVALTKKRFTPGGFHFLLNNEVMLNFGKNIVFNHFDQNRLFVGLVYNPTAHAQVHLGYMNLYQQLASGDDFRNQHTIRLFYFQNLDLRKDPKH